MSFFNAEYALSAQMDTDVAEQEPMARHSSYRIGGAAALYITCHSLHALRRTTEILIREEVPWVVLGKGSNILVADTGYAGAVICLGREFSRTVLDDDRFLFTVGASALLARVVNEALSASLSGLEFAVGIPGSVGGAISMNAGTRTEWIDAPLRHLVSFKPGVGICAYAHDDLSWGYRQMSLPRDEIILEASFELTPAPKSHVRDTMERLLKRRKKTQPLNFPSCGSVFRNPVGKNVGELIDRAGLKGYTVGGAAVSELHANFIVNKGGASAEDVLAVIQHVHERVREVYGIELTPEVKFLGF